jgi:hypothetical protein
MRHARVSSGRRESVLIHRVAADIDSRFAGVTVRWVSVCKLPQLSAIHSRPYQSDYMSTERYIL